MIFFPINISNLFKNFLKSDINKYFLFNVIWSVLSTIINKVLVLFSTILIARFLGQNVYGELAIIKSNTNLFVSFASLGLSLTATKYIAQYRINDKIKTAKIIGLVNTITIIAVFLSTLILFFSSDIFADYILNIPHLSFEIKLSSLIVVFTTLTSLQVGIISGFQNFKEIARNTIKSGILGFFFQLLLTYFCGLGGAIIGLVLSLFFFWITNFISIKKIINKQYPNYIFSKYIFEEFNLLIRFSLPTFLIAIFMELSRWFSYRQMTNFKDGFREMAIFDVSYQWLVAISFIPAIISQVSLPLLSKTIDDKEVYSEIFFKNFKINLLISILICFFFCFFSANILSLYGNEYMRSTDVFIYLVICSTIAAINSSIWQITTSSGHMWINFYINLFWCIILIIFVFIFSREMNLNATNLSISYLIAYFFQTILLLLYFFYYQKNVKIHFFKRKDII